MLMPPQVSDIAADRGGSGRQGLEAGGFQCGDAYVLLARVGLSRHHSAYFKRSNIDL